MVEKNKIRKKFDNAAGKICEAIIPIKQEYYLGGGKDIAICTLSSMNLLEKISNSETIMERVAIAGRLLSENRGIDAMVKFSQEHLDLKQIILCGKEVKGHKAGQAIISLHKNGIDSGGRIIGATGPYPILKSPARDVDAFRTQVRIIDMIGVEDISRIAYGLFP